MNTKAVFIDFCKDEIEQKYFVRLKKLFPNMIFIAHDNQKLLDIIKDVKFVFVKRFTKIGKDLIGNAPNLKYIGVFSTAFDCIDESYARLKNIGVYNVENYATESVAEFFFAVLLEHAREIEKAKEQVKSGNYYFNKLLGFELKGKILGVIGIGKIGSRIAEIGAAIGLKIIYFSRHKNPGVVKLGARRMELEKVLSSSDFISLNLPLNDQTVEIINRERIKLLKKGCVLINLSPLALINQKAIMEKADKGKITYIFTYSQKKDINLSLIKKFSKTKNCIVYPSIAARTREANKAKWEIFVSNIERLRYVI